MYLFVSVEFFYLRPELKYVGFPGGISGKQSACQCRKLKRRRFGPWIGKIPRRRAWQPTPVFLLESPRQRSLAGYRPRGHKESGKPEATEHT